MKKLALLTLLSSPLAFAAAEREYADMPALEEAVHIWQEIIGEHETVTSVQHNEALGTVVVSTINKPDNRIINTHVFRNGTLVETLRLEMSWTMAEYRQAESIFREFGDSAPMQELMKQSFNKSNPLRPRNAAVTKQEYYDEAN